jgi:hypothetical protein
MRINNLRRLLSHMHSKRTIYATDTRSYTFTHTNLVTKEDGTYAKHG